MPTMKLFHGIVEMVLVGIFGHLAKDTFRINWMTESSERLTSFASGVILAPACPVNVEPSRLVASEGCAAYDGGDVSVLRYGGVLASSRSGTLLRPENQLNRRRDIVVRVERPGA
jgi:hypothetical protein